jgi:HAD superfamily hydrolase (TIGR01509 family)
VVTDLDSNVPAVAVAAVVFDMDGVLIDSEQAWADARAELTRERGGSWPAGTQERMMGMSSTEWSRFMHDELRVPMEPDEISDAVVERLARRFRDHLPLLPHAREAVERLAARYPLGLASSSNRPIIDLVLEIAGLAGCFKATVSSEEVPHGKPAPDVYLEAARRLDVDASACVAVEDSTNGIRSADAAGMRVIAVPRPDYPPSAEALELAAIRLDSLAELTPRVVERAATTE